MKKKKIAVLGNKGSFHYEMAEELFENKYEIVGNHSFGEIIRAIRNNECQYGLMAIENSTAGSILLNYTLIRESGLTIVGECYKKIELALLSKNATSLETIAKVISHPMALQQCKSFLSSLPGVVLQESADTSKAAETVLLDAGNNVAAIANQKVAEAYNLQILQKDIHCFAKNFTRFFVLSKTENKEENKNKSTLCFHLPHVSGSLADVLMGLKSAAYNLSKIQSMPVAGEPGKYLFYLDVEYPPGGNEKELINSIKKHAEEIKIMGSYLKKEIELK